MPSFATIKDTAREKIETAGPVGKLILAIGAAAAGTVVAKIAIDEFRKRRG